MSASKPIIIDDSDTEAGASFGGDDGYVLHFEALDMPFGQSVHPATEDGDGAASRTTLVPATFFYQHGAEADASEPESYPGDDPMFLESGEY
jgi:hypothetical protein